MLSEIPNQAMRLTYSYCIVGIFVISSPIQTSIGSPTRGSTAERQIIEQKAETYGIDRAEAVAKYEEMFAPMRLIALDAIIYFDKRKAYDIVATALPALDRSVRSLAVSVLLKKQIFGRIAFDALSAELDRINLEKPINSEQRSGQLVSREYISEVLARWVGLPTSGIDPASAESVAEFNALVKGKALNRSIDSPY
jgi:hypothetical protein